MLCNFPFKFLVFYMSPLNSQVADFSPAAFYLGKTVN